MITNGNLIIDLLANDGCITIPKILIQKLGLEEAILIGELSSKLELSVNYEENFDGWFPETIAEIEENCGLKAKTQTRIIKKLTEMGLIQTKNKGLPAKRHFWINMENLFSILNEENEEDAKNKFEGVDNHE